MDAIEFEDWLERLGDDLSQWPQPQRELARALLAESAAARTLLEEAVILREALAAPVVRAPAGLADRIVAQALQPAPARPEPLKEAAPPPSRFKFQPAIRRLTAAGLLSFCFLAGLLIGLFASPEEIMQDRAGLPSCVADIVNPGQSVD